PRVDAQGEMWQCASLPRFLFAGRGPHRHPHSFPTRRSSDLDGAALAFGEPVRDAGGKPMRFGIPPRAHFVGTQPERAGEIHDAEDRKSTRLNSSHVAISYAVFCLKKKTTVPEHQ